MRRAAVNAAGVAALGLAIFALGVVLIVDTITGEDVRRFASRFVLIPLGLLLTGSAIWWLVGRIVWDDDRRV